MVPMPELITCRLTFSTVMSIFEKLIDEPSGLMRGCLILAALKSAEADADQALRVVVRQPAEIAVCRGTLLQELFLVTPRAELPTTMAARASRLLEDADLPRIHVLTQKKGGATEGERTVGTSMTSGGTSGYQDVSVLDLWGEIESTTARLLRPLRRTALHRLDQYLRDHVDPDLADEYVLSLYDARPDIVREPAWV